MPVGWGGQAEPVPTLGWGLEPRGCLGGLQAPEDQADSSWDTPHAPGGCQGWLAQSQKESELPELAEAPSHPQLLAMTRIAPIEITSGSIKGAGMSRTERPSYEVGPPEPSPRQHRPVRVCR